MASKSIGRNPLEALKSGSKESLWSDLNSPKEIVPRNLLNEPSAEREDVVSDVARTTFDSASSAGKEIANILNNPCGEQYSASFHSLSEREFLERDLRGATAHRKSPVAEDGNRRSSRRSYRQSGLMELPEINQLKSAVAGCEVGEIEASVRAGLFNIRTLVSDEEHRQLLDRDNDKINASVDALFLPQKQRSFCMLLLPLAARRKILRELAFVAVVTAPLQLGIEPVCEVSADRSVAFVFKIAHFICSIAYLVLAVSIYIERPRNGTGDNDGTRKSVDSRTSTPDSMDSSLPERSMTIHSLSGISRRFRVWRAVQRGLQQGFLGHFLDMACVLGIVAEVVHLVEEPPEKLPSWSQWLWLIHLCKAWRICAPPQHRSCDDPPGVVLQVVMLFLWLLFAAHMFACTMSVIAIHEAAAGTPSLMDDHLRSSMPLRCGQFYMSGLYFATQTCTSVGYGNIYPVNTLEQIPVVIFMLFSQLYSAKIIADFTWITSMHQYWQMQHHGRITQTKGALKSMGVPSELRRRVLAYQNFLDEVKKDWHARQCMGDLSEPLREEIKITCYHSLVSQAPFLQVQPIRVIGMIVNTLEDRVYLPCDAIMRRGDAGNELFFLRSGYAGVYGNQDMPGWRDAAIRFLSTGAYFGEVALLTGQPRSCWVVARKYCICSVLPKSKIDEISAEVPSSFVALVNSMRELLQLKPTITWTDVHRRISQTFRSEREARCFTIGCDPKEEEEQEEARETTVTWVRFVVLMDKLGVQALDQKLLWAEVDEEGIGEVTFEKCSGMSKQKGLRRLRTAENLNNSQVSEDKLRDKLGGATQVTGGVNEKVLAKIDKQQEQLDQVNRKLDSLCNQIGSIVEVVQSLSSKRSIQLVA